MAGFLTGTNYTWNDTKTKWFETNSTTVSVPGTTTTLVHQNIKLDGSSATSNLNITASSGHATLLGGAGDDALTFNIAAATVGMFVNAGAGSDVIGITQAGTVVQSTGTFGTDTINVAADVATTFDLKSFKFADLDFAGFTSTGSSTYTANVVVGSSGGLVIKNATVGMATAGDLSFVTSDKTFSAVLAASTAAGDTLLGSTAAGKDYIRQYGNFATTFNQAGDGDTLIGAGGADTYTFGADYVANTSKIATFNGGEGIDVIAVTAASASYTLDLDNSKFTSVEVIDASGANATTGAQVLRGLSSTSQGDTLIGGTGADSIWSKAGADSVKGGAGADTFWFAAGDGTDTIADFATNADVARFNGVSMSALSYAWDSTNGGLIVSYNSASAADSVFLANTGAYANSGAQFVAASDNKTFGIQAVYNNYAPTGQTALGAGTTGADYIRNFYTGTPDADTILTYNGGGGADTIIGGSGKDSVVFDKALAYVDGGEGKDTLVADAPGVAVTIDLYNNAAKYLNFEVAKGNSAADVLRGYASASETLDGAAGNDQLWSAGGNDSLIGGTGADTFWFAAGDGADTVSAGLAGEKDVLKFSGISQGAITSITKNADLDNSLVFGYTSGASVTIDNFSDPTYMKDLSFQFSDVTFHMITDQAGANLAGSTSADVMIALGDGDRTFTGNGGKDSVFGGAGNDTVVYKSDLAYVNGGAGIDGLEVGSAIYTPATINLSDSKFVSIEKVTGGAGADVLRGAAAAETLAGGAGADALWGGAGNDYLQGDAGADTYWFTAGDGVDTIANQTENSADAVKFYAVAQNTDVAAAIVDGSLNITLTDGSKLVLESWESATAKVNKFTFDNGTYSLSTDAKTWTKI